MGRSTRRIAIAALLAGGIAIGGAALATNGFSAAATAANAGAASSGSVAATTLSNGTGATTPGSSAGPDGADWPLGITASRRGGFRHGGRLGRGAILTVGSVNASANTINATRWDGQAVTVTVSATTAYTEAGSAASLGDVQKGSVIAVRAASGTAPGATSIQATGITIVLPREGGVVTAINGATLTLTGFDGTTHTVTVDGNTRYQRAGHSAALSAVTTGTAIVAEGTTNSDGSLTARRITIQVPRIAGQVTSIKGSSYTVTDRFGGTTYTVNTTGSTTYASIDGAEASASSIKTGDLIAAEGTLSADGKTLNAERIMIGPSRAGAPFGSGHGHVGNDGAGGPDMGFGDRGQSNGSVPGTTGTTGAPSV